MYIQGQDGVVTTNTDVSLNIRVVFIFIYNAYGPYVEGQGGTTITVVPLIKRAVCIISVVSNPYIYPPSINQFLWLS